MLTEHPPPCPAGHDFIPGRTIVGWQPCMCQGGAGHRTYWCAVHDVEVMVPIVGWYSSDRAKRYSEGTRWDGNNNVSLATGDQWRHQQLVRTAGGRWVLSSWSDWQGSRELHEFVSDDAALAWLIACEYTEADIERITGEQIEEERAPGRPEIGPAFSVRFPAALLARVDEARGETSRAAWLRQAAEATLT